MLHQVEHANGVTETIATKPGFPMQRPHQITTSGVAGSNNWSSGTYLYDGAGNVKRIGGQRYQYDRMSRLLVGEVLVGGQEKTQSLAYDAFGNLGSLTTDGSFQSTPTSNATNRLTGADASYDAGGNLTDLTLGGETYEYTYDPLNMMKYLQSDTGQARVFLYDADDERIMTFDCAFVDGDCAVPAQLTTTIRGLDGKVLRVYNQPFGGAWNWERDYVYRDGQLLASVEPTAGGGEDTVHFHLDHLGSPRQITDGFGVQATFHSYYPFGGEATDPSQDDVALKFTGHERDDNGSSGTGVLDYMHARYYSPGLGRLFSIDPKPRRTRLRNPQRLNRYTYALGNPVNAVDPDGQEVIYAGAGAKILQRWVERLASRVPGIRATLDLYMGEGSPDLTIRRGSAGSDRGGSAASQHFHGKFDPSYEGNYDKLKGEADIFPATGKHITSAKLISGEIVVGLDQKRGTKKELRDFLHELGHADLAASDTVRYLVLSADDQELDEFGKPLPHDERPVEVEANEYALEFYHLAVEVMKD